MKTGTTEVKKAVCMWCHSHCPVSVHLKDGKLEKIEEPLQHPLKEMLAPVVRACPRARAASEWVYHPDRLRFPLKRAGERGAGKWQQISWDQALDEIAAKLGQIREKYGAEAVASARGTHRSHDEYRARFLNLFGTPNLVGAAGSVCFAPLNEVGCAVLGWPVGHTGPHPEKSKCIMLIGANPEQAWRRGWQAILVALKNGAKLIVIDPRRTVPASRADIWLQLRPGTDTALLMSLINVIIEEKLYDQQFVEKWCIGFDELAQRAKDYSPEKMAEVTWVPADKVRAAARLYATTKPASTHSMMGVEHTYTSIQALHARFILPAITGNLDIEGGDLFHGPPPIIPEYRVELGEKLSPKQKAKMLGSDRFPLFSAKGYDLIQENVERVWGSRMLRYRHCFGHAPTLFRAILTEKPYPIKALITLANNPMVSQPNTRLIYEALRKLELYVVMDFWKIPSAELADYLLPAASWLERPGIHSLSDTTPFAEAGVAALSPFKEGEYDRRTDYEFWRGLGIRLGQTEDWPWKTLEEAYDYRLSPLGLTLEEYVKKGGYNRPPAEEKKYLKKGFGTPSGKVELASSILEKMGHDPLPHYYEPPESPFSTPKVARDFPLVLTTGGRFLPMYHSEHRQIPSLRRQHPDPLVQINPQKAKELGIADGDWVWIETPRGRIKQKCQYFTGIDPKVVHAEHGWWFPEQPGEDPSLHGVWQSNINVITDENPDHCNPISGGWPLRGELCRVYKVEET